MTVYPVIGTDVSVWQDDNSTPQRVNFDTMKAAGAHFTFIKVSQANWVDQDLIYNWANAKAAGMLRGAYHYLTFDISPIVQAEYCWSVIRGDPGEFPVVCDFEQRISGLTRGRASADLKAFCERMLSLSGRMPIIYTSPGFWAEFGTSDIYWRRYPLWLAHYTTGTPITPTPWDKWIFWQYTDRGDGKKYGAESLQIDLNYWYSDLKSLYEFAQKPAPPEPVLTWEQQIDAWARTQGYNGVRP